MRKIGLTGGIGSGKSVVADIFKALSIPVFNSDVAAKTIMVTDNNVKQSLIAVFGPSIFNGNDLNKEVLAGIIFSNPEQLKKINAIVHPAVRKYFETWTEQYKNTPYIIQENAILFESGNDAFLDEIITVSCPEHIRIERVMKRDKRTAISIKNIMQNQMSEDEKIKRSQHIIVNDGSILVVPQVLAIHSILSRTT